MGFETAEKARHFLECSQFESSLWDLKQREKIGGLSEEKFESSLWDLKRKSIVQAVRDSKKFESSLWDLKPILIASFSCSKACLKVPYGI